MLVRLKRLHASALLRWESMAPAARGAALVSLGSMTLVVMATVAKFLGDRLHPFEILLFRSLVGFLFILPLFVQDPLEPLRTRRFGLHLTRGIIGWIGNACLFWTITHMLLADAMALQFSRPLFMIPLAMILLAELPGWHRTAVTMIGFFGILLYARPFTEGFDPSAVVGAVGAFFGGVVVVCVKRLSSTEPTRTIMFYYAFWTTVFAILPAAWVWVTPTWTELVLLIAIGLLGISGQACITHGLAQGEATALVPLDYSRILYSAILGYLLFAEIPGPLSIAGMALIVGSSLHLVLTEKRRK